MASLRNAEPGKVTQTDEASDALVECGENFNVLLEAQANIKRACRGTMVLTDREVNDAYSTLLTGREMSAKILCLSHSLSIGGAVIMTSGLRPPHEMPLSLILIAGGIIMAIGGVVLREKK